MNIIEQIEERFVSGNAVPVSRTHLTADEWQQIKAELAKVREDAWQPIETAPKDGSLCTIYSNVHGYVVAWWDQVDGGGHPENGPPVYWWVSDHCEFIDGPCDAPVMWKPLNEISDILMAAP